ncbi:ABC transporter permease [Flexithrix dorotheae]|uniref:ABC transporter permease n=1 Tax=Flexithrix dorotheae TaxID=70993 RepID=UPI000362AF85|nr:ABC transporter permease [Flexithrix dorotheae]
MKESKPPGFFLTVFKWFCRPDLHPYIEGDLLELYQDELKRSGRLGANLKIILDILMLFRPGIIKPITGFHQLNHYGMFKNYFKIGWRNLLKNKSYSVINIGGLAIGMSVAILIGLWVWDELSFNKNHDNYERIAQVMRSGSLNGTQFTYPYLPYALGEELQNAYHEDFKHIIVASLPSENLITKANEKLIRSGIFMQKGAAEMFSFDMISGTINGLEDLHSIFLSSSAALALFGDEDPIGQSLTLDNEMAVQVTGVYKDFPQNSRLYNIDFLAPWSLYLAKNPWIRDQGFMNNFLNIYVELKPGVSFHDASNHIQESLFNKVQDDPQMIKIHPLIHLHPMSKWHLYNEWENGKSTGGLIKFVWLFSLVGLFVLLLACINFMNLSTAFSEKRAKEVGVRKSVGSIRSQLIFQFYMESFLMVLVAFILAILLTLICLNWFNELSGKQLEMPWTNPHFWLGSLIFIAFTGFVSGSYPAFFLSAFNPVKALKGISPSGKKTVIPRRILVIIQFTVSVSLIIGTLVVFKQVQFVKDRPIGYSRDNLLMVRMTTEEFYTKFEALETELLNSGVVKVMSRSLSPVSAVWSSNGGFDWKGKDPDWQPEDFATLAVTPHYGKTVGWQFVAGRDFHPQLASDSTGFVINESAAKLMGFEDPVGERVSWSGTRKNHTIIGVIKDMIMSSPYATPMPTIFYQGDNLNWINIRLNPEVNTQTGLSKIESVFNKVLPAVPFKYKFADQEYAMKFIAEERIGNLSGVFTLLAIFISCLGLFGLASFVAEQRTKEIGIRKILGASTLKLWKLLSFDFIILVLISCFIAIPIAYYAMDNWLQSYEYRIHISWWIFGLSSLGAMIITLVTVSFQTIKSALMNPVQSLRSD